MERESSKHIQQLRPSRLRVSPIGVTFWLIFLAVWFRAFAEDHCVEEKFGKPEKQRHDSEHDQGRTIFCHFFLWRPKFGATLEHEEALAAGPVAKESWNRAIAKVMPPATAWIQERWNILDVPRFLPESETDPENMELADQ